MRNRPVLLAFASLLLLGSAQARETAPLFAKSEPDALSYGAYLSARVAADEHDMADAARFYRQSLDRDPNDPTLLALAFFYETSAGEIDRASELASRMVVATPDDRASRLVLAVSALKRGNYKEARAQIDKSAKGTFASLTVALVDAWAAAGAGDEVSALTDMKSLSGQSGAESMAAFHQALLLDYLGKTEAADAAYNEAMKADVPAPRLFNAYGRFLERQGRKADAQALYDKLASNGALAPVVAVARARMAKGEKPDPMIERPGDGVSEALFGIAASLTEESSADVSVLYLRLALYLKPDFDLANILLGDRMDTLQKYADAIDAYKNVPKDSPYRRMAQIQVATDEARLDKTDDAIAALKQLAADDPNDVSTWTALGDAYRADSKFADAAAAYDHAVTALGTPQKKDWPLFYARAIARDRSKDWPGAEADLQAALKLSPDEPQTLNYLGYSYVDQGRNIPEALKMLEKARSLKPYDGYIVDSVGWAYYKLGRYGEAAKTLQDAILLVPGDPTINDHYGDALWKIGRKLDARFQWNHALVFGPDAPEKSEIEKKLQTDGADHS
ncbi:MAG TPA: tetratricopeptide repeat protein [Rhizomicrobium sp.]|nr:tetratricopeptide repeat protein [Rhizomicrobium sp.]